VYLAIMERISMLRGSFYFTVKLGCNVMKGTECFESLQMSVVITRDYNITVNRGKLVGTTNYLML
jgi:hypothetical protein